MSTSPEPAAKSSPSRARRRYLLMAALPVALIAGAGLWWMASQGHQSTDNAYVHQARLSVAAAVEGRVIATTVADNQPVAKGDLLFQIDPEPFRIELRRTEVALDSARLEVERLKATYAQAVAQSKLAQDTVDYTETNLKRQQALTDRGVTSDSSLDDARHAALSARETAVAADMAVKAALAALGGDADAAVDDHPTVRAAVVARDDAAYQLSQTEIHAPDAGIIYQAASFRPGQMVAAGTTLFTLIETGDTWVDANFKETQLADIRPGQPVEIRLDAAPGTVLTGRVQSIGAGTGSEFSLLPAQNATGNWVKVEQRVPVRISLDDPAAAPLLATGLSADVKVDTRHPGDAGAAAAHQNPGADAGVGAAAAETPKS